MEMEFTKAVEYCFYTAMTGGVAFTVRFLTNISKSLVDIKVGVATLVERSANHKERLDDHDERIHDIEVGKGRKRL